jgi:hypothetical protein
MIRIEIVPDRPARVRGFASGDPTDRFLSGQAGLKLTPFAPGWAAVKAQFDLKPPALRFRNRPSRAAERAI